MYSFRLLLFIWFGLTLIQVASLLVSLLAVTLPAYQVILLFHDAANLPDDLLPLLFGGLYFLNQLGDR